MRDGVVVDFAGAATAVRQLRERAEEQLGAALTSAATAYPPGVSEADARACRYVLEQAGLDCRVLVDEVSAARALLGVDDGAIADVGGGSTGVGVYRDGELVSLGDRPGGGHHLNLILAGGLACRWPKPSGSSASPRRRLHRDARARDRADRRRRSRRLLDAVPPGRCTWSAAR